MKDDHLNFDSNPLILNQVALCVVRPNGEFPTQLLGISTASMKVLVKGAYNDTSIPQ